MTNASEPPVTDTDQHISIGEFVGKMTIMTYEIGYGKPPENTRFQKGNKYYLKRSKRKPKDVAAIINETTKVPVEYREGGRTRKATWSELSFRALVRRAANGNLRSMEMVIDEFAHAQRVGDPGNQIIEVRDWLPDYPGQTGEQKTREFAERSAAEATEWWKPASADPAEESD